MQPQPRQELGANRPASPRLVHWAAALGVALFVASRVTAIYTVAINWDEFALLDGVARYWTPEPTAPRE